METENKLVESDGAIAGTTEVTENIAPNETLVSEHISQDHVENGLEHTADEELVEDHMDYSGFSKEQLVEASTELLLETNFRKIDERLKKLKAEIDRMNRSEKEEALKAFVEAGGETDAFEYKQDKMIAKFFENFKALKDRKTKYFAELEGKKQKNLDQKKQIIEQIKALLEGTDITKAAVDKLRDLQKQWKAIGQVPPSEADDLYKTYKALLDRFYSQKNIEHELVMLDRKRNLETKTEICDKAEALLNETNLNAAIAQLNKLHDEYKSTGSVGREEQEALWKRFKDASDKLYEKKRQYVDELKGKLEANMKIKQELCLKIEAYTDFDSEKITEWNEKTKEILALQESWDKIGPVPREVAKTINKQFWANFKAFFNKKSQFFEKIESVRGENLKLKVVLCEKVEALKENSDWDATAEQIKHAQEEWKGIGPVPETDREKIFERFKAACDFFFERKRNRRNEQDKEFNDNLQKKTDICKEIEALQPTAKPEEVQKLIEKWFEIGFVPRKNITDVQDALLASVEKTAEKLTSANAEGKEKLVLDLQMRLLGTTAGGGAASKQIAKKEQNLRRKLTNLENDIALWKNNLAFFANSKTADKLKEEFGVKIKEASTEVEQLKAQLKTIQQAKSKGE